MINVNLLMKGASTALSRNSPAILTGAAVSGVLATTILAVRATPQAIAKIDEHENANDQKLTPLEKIKIAGKYYIPALCVGLSTMACIVGLNAVHLKRQAALMTVYTVTEKAFADYQAKVTEHIGATKEEKVRAAVAEDKVRDVAQANGGIIVSSSGKSVFVDGFSNRQFESDMESVRRAENDIKKQLHNEFYASLNDFYTLLGVPRNRAGDELGWNVDKPIDLRFVPIISDDGKPAIVVEYKIGPKHGYADFHG